MTDITASTEPAGRELDAWTARALVARHKAVAIGTLAVVVLLIAFTVAGIASSGQLVVSDASTCTAWSSANYTQQRAYAARYVREHGSLPGGARDAASVLAAIDNGCDQAFSNDVQDTITVVQAIQQ